MLDHKKRFAKWHQRIPVKSRYLVDRVLERLVPDFEKHGFVWYPDFAGNNPQEIGANEIPLQRREGATWPTVQITFPMGAWGPRFKIAFSVLPEICKNPIHDNIPREQAIAAYGPAYFHLCRGRWHDFRDSEFGFNWMLLLLPTPAKIFRIFRYLLSWRRFLDAEIETAMAILPILFESLDKGVPEEWIDHSFGRINKHVFLIHSWKMTDKLRVKNEFLESQWKENLVRGEKIRLRPLPSHYLYLPIFLLVVFSLIIGYGVAFKGQLIPWGFLLMLLLFIIGWIIWHGGREMLIDDATLSYRSLLGGNRSIQINEIDQVAVPVDDKLVIYLINHNAAPVEINLRPFRNNPLLQKFLSFIRLRVKELNKRL